MQEIRERLRCYSLDKLKKLVLVVFYDTDMSDLDEETKESLIKSITREESNDMPGQMFQEDGIWMIWTREGKVGDAVSFEELISSMETGENWQELKW